MRGLKRLVLAVFVILGLFIFSGVGEAAILIYGCTNITAPGVYELAQDITDVTVVSCINITVSDVVLDCKGHTIQRTARETDTYGVYVKSSTTLTNVTIRNLKVRWWDAGIYFENVQNGKIINNTAVGNDNGIQLVSSDNNTITNNTLSNNVGFGLLIDNSNNNTIASNVIINNNFGIDVYASTNNTMANNTLTENSYGIKLSSSSSTNRDTNNNIVVGNVINGTYNFGLELWNTDNNTISNNIITNNRYNGIYFEDSNNNTVINNVIIDSSDYGIELRGYSGGCDHNSIVNNIIKNNDGGIRLYKYCDHNTIANNSITNNNNEGIYLRLYCNYNSIINNTITNNNDIGIYLVDHCKYNTITGNVIASNSEEGVYIEYYESDYNSITGNLIDNNEDNGIYIDSCSNNTIADNQITNNFDAGIELYDCSHSTVINNTIANNGWNGIYSDAYYSTIVNNTITNNSMYGIYLLGTSSIVTNNTFISDGLFVEDSYANTVTNNIVNGKPLVYLENADNVVVSDAGQVIAVNSNNITVENLNLSYTDVGVEFWNTSYSLIANCMITNCIHGIYFLDACEYNNVTGNTITGNDYGIQLWGYYSPCNNNMIANNTVANNNRGIELSQANYNRIYNNIFNNIANYFGDTSPNFWNTTKQAGTNIVRGPYLGGNYWAKPDRTGFSQTCNDTDGDGICDLPYQLDANNIDYQPLKDIVPPSITIISPISTTTYATSTIQINVTASDPSGIAEVKAEIDGITNVTLAYQNGYYVNTTTLADGNHWIRIYAKDNAGNVNSSIVYFTIQTGQPDIRIVKVDVVEESIELGESATIKVTAYNYGNAAGSYTTTLQIIKDGVTVYQKQITFSIPPNQYLTYVTKYRPASPGTYIATADGYSDSFKVLAPANLSVSFSLNTTSGVAPLSVEINATIINTGDLAGSLTVYFYVEGLEVYNETVEVEGGTTEYVTYVYTFEEPGTYNVSINDLPAIEITVLAPANITVVGLDVIEDSVELGESVTINVTVHNYGDVAGNATINVTIAKPNGTDYVEIEFTDVAPGATVTESAVYTPDQEGAYTVTADSYSDSFTVVVPPPAYFELSNFSVTPTEGYEPLEITASVTITNVGSAAGNYTAILLINSTPVDSLEGTLEAGDSTTVTFTYTLYAGSYSVAIAVLQPDGTSTTTDSVLVTVVTPPPGPTVEVTTDQTTYYGGDPMQVTITITNPGESVTVGFVWELQLLTFGTTIPIYQGPITLPAHSQIPIDVSLTLPTGLPSFNAAWHVAIYNVTTGELISEDYAYWQYIGAKKGKAASKEMVKERFSKLVQGIDLDI